MSRDKSRGGSTGRRGVKQLPLLSSELYCRPWAILPAAHAELCRLYRAYLSGTLPAPDEGRERWEEARMVQGGRYVSEGVRYEYDTELGVAVIVVAGVIAKQDPETLSGPRVASLLRLSEALQEVRQLDVPRVVLYLHTPGGSSTGLPEAAAEIEELAAAKEEVVAYADTQCTSAGEWLAAACDRNYYAPSAVIGSIGSYIAGIDSSRAWEMDGMQLKLYRHGKLKAIGLPGKVWTEDEEAYLKELVERHGEEFREWMRSRRPGIADADMEGQWFVAAHAPAALVDGYFRSVEELVAALAE